MTTGTTKEQQARAAWLASLGPGDEVAIRAGRWGDQRFFVLQIERLTATQFVMGCGSRYRRDNGQVVGSGYAEIRPVTREIRDDIERAELARWLDGLVRHGRCAVPLETLRAMKAAFDEAAK